MEEITAPDKLKPLKVNSFRRFMWKFTFVLLLLLAFLIYWFYYNSKSDGTRVGRLFKFSRKGDVFKTHEAEVKLPGSRAGQNGGFDNNYWYFSVTEDSIANLLEKAQGKEVEVHYYQYRKNLPWRGENYDSKNSEPGQYIVDKIIAIRDAVNY
jgi:hypothetical protein